MLRRSNDGRLVVAVCTILLDGCKFVTLSTLFNAKSTGSLFFPRKRLTKLKKSFAFGQTGKNIGQIERTSFGFLWCDV